MMVTRLSASAIEAHKQTLTHYCAGRGHSAQTCACVLSPSLQHTWYDEERKHREAVGMGDTGERRSQIDYIPLDAPQCEAGCAELLRASLQSTCLVVVIDDEGIFTTL